MNGETSNSYPFLNRRGILLNMFIDTLFFSQFYPDTGTCQNYNTKQDCLANSADHCRWHIHNKKCEKEPPPKDLVFVMVVALLTVIVVAPLDLVIGYVMDEFASKRPILEDWGLNSNAFLGSNVPSLIGESEYLAHDSPMQLIMYQVRNEKNQETSEEKHSFRDVENKFMAHGSYYDHVPAIQEASHLMDEVKGFFEAHIDTSFLSSRDVLDKRGAKLRAIMKYFRVYSSGSPAPLSLVDTLRFGTFHNKLVHRIKNLRKSAREIGIELMSMELQGFDDLVDTFLMQRFVIEQFGFMKRYVLNHNFFEIVGGLCPPQIDAWSWLFAWIFVIAW
jgi:hypothetical protein